MSLKVIIVGAGMAGGKLHLNAYREVAGVEVSALCDPDLDRAKIIARQNGVPHVYSSVEEALSAQAADIVSVCSPPSSHFEVCRIALEHSCHVLVEKPIFQTLDEAEQIKALVARKGCKFSVVHNLKYQYGMQQAAKLVREGAVGDILQVHAVRMINGNTDRLAADPYSWCHKLPGGRWEELIPHPIYKAYQFMGPMRFVHLEMKRARSRCLWLPADEMEIVLEGATGYVSIKVSANAANYNFMVVYGSKRYLYVDSEAAVDLLSMTSHIRSRPSVLKFLHDCVFSSLRSRKESPGQDPHATLIRDFVAYIDGKSAEPPVDWEEAFNVLELGLQIGREIQERKAIPVAFGGCSI